MLGSRYEQPKYQSTFYRDQFHKILRWLNIVSSLILLVSLVIIYYLLNPESPHYYATTTTGQIIPISSTPG